MKMREAFENALHEEVEKRKVYAEIIALNGVIHFWSTLD